MIVPLLEGIFGLFSPKAESAEALLKLDPARRYTREEVVRFLDLAAGIAVDGAPIEGFSVIKESSQWYSVDVDYGAEYQTWYFFKADGGQL